MFGWKTLILVFVLGLAVGVVVMDLNFRIHRYRIEKRLLVHLRAVTYNMSPNGAKRYRKEIFDDLENFGLFYGIERAIWNGFDRLDPGCYGNDRARQYYEEKLPDVTIQHPVSPDLYNKDYCIDGCDEEGDKDTGDDDDED